MRVLVTGATGKVGFAIANALLERGDRVRALVRDLTRAAGILPAGIEPIRGDVTDAGSLAAAVEGCELVFNSMGMPEQWVRDESIFDRVNAVGSAEVARAAKRAGVRRFVHTSTHDVFHADTGGRFDETTLADYPKGTAYERSKQHAEELVLAERDGMEVVILNPSGVYGPTPSPTPSFENSIFEPVVRKRLPAVPPGGTGYAYVEGVAAGHLLAAEKGARRRALHPRRRLRGLPRAGGDSKARRRTGPRPAEDAGPRRQGGRGPRRRNLTRDPPAAAAAPRAAHLLPLAGAPRLLQGTARARLEDDAARGGRSQDTRLDGPARGRPTRGRRLKSALQSSPRWRGSAGWRAESDRERAGVGAG